MIDEEHLTDIDISDIIEDNESENYIDSEAANVNNETGDLSAINSEIGTEEQPAEKGQQSHKSEISRPTRLPIARIKNIMKMDPDVNVISGDAVFLVTKATELFLETIVKETYSYTSSNKRKVISKKDLEQIINKVDCLCFLEGAMDF